MTRMSDFVRWLIVNNKLETYTLMTDVMYNSGSIMENRETAKKGINELEKRFMENRLNIDKHYIPEG